MLRSMTGFARSETTTPEGQLLWEIRSVNHRYLEIQLKLPEAFRALDPEIRQRMSARIGRGRVEATLTVRNAGDQLRFGRLNLPLARQIIGHAATIAGEMAGGAAKGMGEAAPVSALDVLRWPGVLEQEELDPGPLFPAVLALLDEALTDLTAARGREGERIGEMLERRLAEIEAQRQAVIARLPAVLEGMNERLRSRVEALNVTVDGGRLEQELTIIAQKLDVTEELDRLGSHIAEFRRILGTEEPVGRRLDFLVQELNREANTLASKSADAETTRQAVDIKVLLEQIREQIQNVE